VAYRGSDGTRERGRRHRNEDSGYDLAPLSVVSHSGLCDHTLGIFAPVVGAARAALDEFISSMAHGTRGGGIVGELRRTAESAVLQSLVAEIAGVMVSVTETEMSVERCFLNCRDDALAVRICVPIVNSLL
jgi:hypothetical protein